MNHEQAAALAKVIANAFPGRLPEDAMKAYAENFLTLDIMPARAAIDALVKGSERLPTIAAILKAYYAERKKAGRPVVPCGPCQREGGWRVRPDSSVLNPPREAIAPYDGYSRLTDAEGKDAGPAWTAEPMCASHGRTYTETLWREHLAKKAAAKAQGQLPMPGLPEAW